MSAASWGTSSFGLADYTEELSSSGFRPQDLSLLEIPALAISSTDCRGRVGRGMPVWYLVPDGVVQYIAKRALYRADGNVVPV